MPSFENVRQIKESSSADANKSLSQDPQLKREYYFRALVLSHLLNTVRESLENAEFSESEIEEFNSVLAKLTEDDQFAVLSIPFELRTIFFARYHKRMEDGEISVTEAVDEILKTNKKYGFSVGYHLSDHAIPMNKQGNKWDIKGSEFDDRDEMKMAYYSEDYVSRYKKKPGRFLYVVRAEMNAGSPHKRDLSNRWSRAPLLSIIDECDMREIENEISSAIQNENAASHREAA